MEQKQNLHSDHTVSAVNKLAPRADFFAYETEQLAVRGNPDLSQRFIALNGSWKFHWSKSPRERVKNFYEVGLDDSIWGIGITQSRMDGGKQYHEYLNKAYLLIEKYFDTIPSP